MFKSKIKTSNLSWPKMDHFFYKTRLSSVAVTSFTNLLVYYDTSTRMHLRGRRYPTQGWS